MKPSLIALRDRLLQQAKNGRVVAFATAVALCSGQASAVDLLLFGDANHDEFLGCITCNHFDATSICNTFGRHGSTFSNVSIWNGFSPYGSQFSQRSPWNSFANTPPVIVDKQGNFYGYLTANQFNPKRTQIKALVQITDASDRVVEDMEAAQKALCGE